MRTAGCPLLSPSLFPVRTLIVDVHHPMSTAKTTMACTHAYTPTFDLPVLLSPRRFCAVAVFLRFWRSLQTYLVTDHTVHSHTQFMRNSGSTPEIVESRGPRHWDADDVNNSVHILVIKRAGTSDLLRFF